MKLKGFSAFLILAAPLGAAQITVPTTQFFEVASVKSVADSDRGDSTVAGGPGTSDPGLVTYTHLGLDALLMRAFEIKPFQLLNFPSSARRRYDVIAKVPAGSTKEQVRVMLLNLLVERFNLTYHREKKTLSIYQLVVADKGPKLKETTPADGAQPQADQVTPSKVIRTVPDTDGLRQLPPGMPGMAVWPTPRGVRVSARMMPIRQLVISLSGQVDRPLVDSTGLTGLYDFNLDFWRPSPNVPADDPNSPGMPGIGALDRFPGLAEALERQLGLKLQPTQGQIDMLVIDAINAIPIEN